jgi:glycosyltransferase involved in cell wall biosynthesis
MIIGYDAKRAFANNTGLGNYSRYIIDNALRYAPAHDYRLYAPRMTRRADVAAWDDRANVRFGFPTSVIDRALPSLWRTTGIVRDLRRDGVRLFHGLSNEIPVGLRAAGIRSIVTIHDVIFLRFPQYYKPIDRAIYRRKMQYACREADHIVAVSQCTARDVAAYFGVPSEKISVVYQGCNAAFRTPCLPEQIAAARAKYGLHAPYVLNVGTIEPRKNLLLAVEALAMCENTEVELVAVGRATPYADEVRACAERLGIARRVHLLTSVSSDDLRPLYQGASVFVYPSRYEGFGIPILEALSSGVPVVAATGSCLEEAGGANSIYIDPDNAGMLANVIRIILSDTLLRNAMIAEGKVHAAAFDDRALTAQMDNLYARIGS